jgi:transposase InsO family protein
VALDFTRPGKPTDNGHIESFNGRLRDEFLNVPGSRRSPTCAPAWKRGALTTTSSGPTVRSAT